MKPLVWRGLVQATNAVEKWWPRIIVPICLIGFVDLFAVEDIAIGWPRRPMLPAPQAPRAQQQE